MTQSNELSTLNSLIETLIDSVTGFEDAAGNLDSDSRLRAHCGGPVSLMPRTWWLRDLVLLVFFVVALTAAWWAVEYLAAWWPPGHIIGYEHEFHHAVVDFMHAIETGGEIRPNFYDGLAEMQVLGAAAESASRPPPKRLRETSASRCSATNASGSRPIGS